MMMMMKKCLELIFFDNNNNYNNQNQNFYGFWHNWNQHSSILLLVEDKKVYSVNTYISYLDLELATMKLHGYLQLNKLEISLSWAWHRSVPACLLYSDPLFLNLHLFITIADLVLFIAEFMFDISVQIFCLLL